MNTVSITDMYMDVLASLSDEEKLDLITKLTHSILDKKKKKKKNKRKRNGSVRLLS